MFEGSISIQEGRDVYSLALPEFEKINGPFAELQVDASTAISARTVDNVPISLLPLVDRTHIAIHSFSPHLETELQSNMFFLMGGDFFRPSMEWTSRSYQINSLNLNTLNYIRRMPRMSSYSLVLGFDNIHDLARFHGTTIWLTLTATRCISPFEAAAGASSSGAYDEYQATRELSSQHPDLANLINEHQDPRNSVAHNPYTESQAAAKRPTQRSVLTDPQDQHLSLTTIPVQYAALANDAQSLDDGKPVLQILNVYNIIIGVEFPVERLRSGYFPTSLNGIIDFKVTIGKLDHKWVNQDMYPATLEQIRCFVRVPMKPVSTEFELNPDTVPLLLPLQLQPENTKILRSYSLDSDALKIVNRLDLRELVMALYLEERFDRAVGSTETKDQRYALTAYATVLYWPVNQGRVRREGGARARATRE